MLRPNLRLTCRVGSTSELAEPDPLCAWGSFFFTPNLFSIAACRQVVLQAETLFHFSFQVEVDVAEVEWILVLVQ